MRRFGAALRAAGMSGPSSQERTLPVRALKDGDTVSFDATDSKAPTPGSSLGTAEFAFCPQWNRGKLKAVHITPMQQREVSETFVVEGGFSDSFAVSSWTHKGIDAPRPWIWFWCKEHRCMGMRVYVPRNSSRFSVRVSSDIRIDFDGASA
jgi:hypothetical protein